MVFLRDSNLLNTFTKDSFRVLSGTLSAVYVVPPVGGDTIEYACVWYVSLNHSRSKKVTQFTSNLLNNELYRVGINGFSRH